MNDLVYLYVRKLIRFINQAHDILGVGKRNIGETMLKWYVHDQKLSCEYNRCLFRAHLSVTFYKTLWL